MANFHIGKLVNLVVIAISTIAIRYCYFDENHIFSIEAILRHKQVAYMRRKMLFLSLIHI